MLCVAGTIVKQLWDPFKTDVLEGVRVNPVSVMGCSNITQSGL